MALIRYTGDNFGGISRLWVCRKDLLLPFFSGNVCTMTKAQFSSVFAEIQFLLGDAYPKRGSGQALHGPYKELSISIEIKKMLASTEAILDSYEGAEVCSVYLTHDNTYVLVGSPGMPMEFSSDYDGGRVPADGQVYNILISGKQLVKSPSIIIQ